MFFPLSLNVRLVVPLMVLLAVRTALLAYYFIVVGCGLYGDAGSTPYWGVGLIVLKGI